MKIFHNSNKWGEILINPFILGLILTFIAALFLREKFDKFRVSLVYSGNVFNMSQNYFHDMDNDGSSEWIELGYDRHSKAFPYYILYQNLDADGGRLIIDQYNLPSLWIDNAKAHFGDVDNDGKDELLLLARKADSLFLLCGDPLDNLPILFEVFLSAVSYREESPDFEANILECHDFDRDGFKDVLVRINAGLNLRPREYFIYNFHNDTLIQSHMGYAHLSGATVCDVNDSTTVIIPKRSYSPRNVKFPAPYSDTLSWLTTFDGDLQFLFPPVPNAGYKTNLQARLRRERGEFFIYTVFFDHDRKNNPPSLRKYDLKGNLVKEKRLDDEKFKTTVLNSFDIEGAIYLKGADIFTCREVRPDLSFGPGRNCNLSENPLILDLNDDGKSEFIIVLVEDDYKISICQDNFRHAVSFPAGTYPGTLIVSGLKTTGGIANLAVQSGSSLSYYRFSRNPLFYWNYLFLAVIWAGISLFLYFLLRAQRKQLQKRYENERKMIELELMTIKNQADPHFILNTMNSIGAYILKEEKKKAYDYLTSFSRMIHSALTHSSDIKVRLEDELDFVEKYLSLEQMRLKGSFDYSITLVGDVDPRVEIPRMIVQTFAENAVKHGLRYKEGAGRLEIEASQVDNTLYIRIEDDGIGREGSRKLKTHHTGQGSNIIRQIVSLFNRLNITEVSYDIEDLAFADGRPGGTRVTVSIPIKDGKK